MFSLDKTNKPIGIVRPEAILIYQNEDVKQDTVKKPLLGNSVRLQDTDGKLSLLPTNVPNQRDSIFVAGASGSGKSQWTRLYIMNYKAVYPKRSVFIFSSVQEDQAYDDLDVYRVILDDNFTISPPEIESLHQSLCVFDDVDTMSNKDLQKAVLLLQEQILERGRHHEISICSLHHMVAKGHRTRSLLNESNYIVLFPVRGNNLTRYFLKTYSGLDKANQEKIYSLPSRWVCLQIGYPGFVMHEKGVYIPS